MFYYIVWSGEPMIHGTRILKNLYILENFGCEEWWRHLFSVFPKPDLLPRNIPILQVNINPKMKNLTRVVPDLAGYPANNFDEYRK